LEVSPREIRKGHECHKRGKWQGPDRKRSFDFFNRPGHYLEAVRVGVGPYGEKGKTVPGLGTNWASDCLCDAKRVGEELPLCHGNGLVKGGGSRLGEKLKRKAQKRRKSYLLASPTGRGGLVFGGAYTNRWKVGRVV